MKRTKTMKLASWRVIAIALILCCVVASGFLLQKKTVVNAILTETERAENGISFADANEIYETKTNLKTMPKTYEAILHLPTTQASRAGILFGNYGPTNTTACYSFEVQWDSTKKVCYPKLYYDVDNVGKTNPGVVNINFTGVDVRSTGFIHLAITHDTANSKAYCYINGELKQTLDVTNNDTIKNYYNGFNFVPSKNGRIGGDFRSGNGQYFKGNIKGLEFYTDVRTAEEIKADYQRWLTAPTGDNLLAAYNFTLGGRSYLKDLSSNGYDINYSGAEDYSDLDGLTFVADSKYEVVKDLEVAPNTFEAEIFLPKNYVSRAGVIFGNWGIGSSLSFEVNTDGKPRLFHSVEGEGDLSLVFNADVRTGDWAHLAIVHDKQANVVNCYIDGKFVSAANYKDYKGDVLAAPFCVGGDNRSGNEQYFKGWIKSVAVFSDTRSATEIKNDAEGGIDATDENLLAYYQVGKASAEKDIEDLSGNGYKLHYQTTWFAEKEPVKDYAYSFAVVGDTQIIAEKYPDKMAGIYDWIIDNKEEKKISYVFGLGDITNSNTPAEWNVAKAAVSKLDGVLPYSLVRGNHDSSTGMQTFNYPAYTNQFGGFYKQGYIDTSWREFSVAGTNYLMVNLDYGADDAELAWAGALIDEFPNHKVIITTHAYMYRDGTTLGPNDVCPPADSNDANASPNKVYNNGDQMWDKLISQHGNIFLVLSGHDPCDNVVTRQSVGVHGNTVTQMLIDAQGMDAGMGATGMVAMLYFSEDGQQIDVEFYSTVHKQYYKESNQYSIKVYDQTVQAHTFDQEVVSDFYKANTPDCDTPAMYYKSCVCGESGQETFAYGEADGHKYADEHTCHDRECVNCDHVEQATTQHSLKLLEVIENPLPDKAGKAKYKCTVCQEEVVAEYGKATGGIKVPGCGSSAVGGLAGLCGLLIVSAFVVFTIRRKNYNR